MRGETGRTYKSEGVVLKRTNFGEADRIITFYTKHYGKITAIAKGIRRITSRKRGNLEIFNVVSFFAAKGKGMDIVTEAETINAFGEWRKNLKKVAAAYEICEIVDKLTAERSEQEEVYGLLVEYLQKLGAAKEEELEQLVNHFGGDLLKFLGFWARDKSYPPGFSVYQYIEQITEREIKSKKFSRKI